MTTPIEIFRKIKNSTERVAADKRCAKLIALEIEGKPPYTSEELGSMDIDNVPFTWIDRSGSVPILRTKLR